MTWNHRFASLQGASRKWLSYQEFALEIDRDQYEDPDPPSVTDDREGCDDWMPLKPRRQPLARLKDVISGTGLAEVAPAPAA